MTAPFRFAPALLLCLCAPAWGFSQGSPVCEVNSLPLVEMSPTLADPPPVGWTLQAPLRYVPGTPITVALRHPDPGRRVRGVLLWARSGPLQGAGRFDTGSGDLWQYIPAAAGCGQWAISHVDATPKAQTLLRFRWTADAALPTILRAFLIEDCSAAQGCRDQQALTPVLQLQPALFIDGFEADPQAVEQQPAKGAETGFRADSSPHRQAARPLQRGRDGIL